MFLASAIVLMIDLTLSACHFPMSSSSESDAIAQRLVDPFLIFLKTAKPDEAESKVFALSTICVLREGHRTKAIHSEKVMARSYIFR